MATTPSRSAYSTPTRGAPRAAEPTTSAMRDRQARGKDPYRDGSESDYDDDSADRRVRLGRRLATEPFEDKERRGFALSVLDCPESLTMYALGAGDVRLPFALCPLPLAP
ncbi:uncharacterized protein MAM_01001 [Metarhizium album ARSEF 1941]|uniref:Uncharacterized protein n=1 Tax=Metarhizium album (strain ARSEF 1941) TaxID=1081103 RepID=A0A0B2X8W1_METAS|nr:uncharacterized protein MAM_01001 [Metarhizium album ARSEF 1941]KHO02000.1 hypothetical protein MAM_01001 [Metarhizium album ARSEF 1941]